MDKQEKLPRAKISASENIAFCVIMAAGFLLIVAAGLYFAAQL